jgi:hypothetical protein
MGCNLQFENHSVEILMMDDLMITSIWDITQIKGLGLGLKLGTFTHIISF